MSDVLPDQRIQDRPRGTVGHAMLPIDRDLDQLTEGAMRETVKGKERAQEDAGWDFGPPLSVREGMFAGKVLR